MKPAIRSDRRGWLFFDVYLQYDVARQHIAARHTVKQIQNIELDVLFHSPFSLHLALVDFHIFWTRKDALRRRHFRSDEEVKKTALDLPTEQPKNTSAEEFTQWRSVRGDVRNVVGATLKINFTVLLLVCYKSLDVTFSAFSLERAFAKCSCRDN
jgi:hypothetical protein